MARVVNVIHKPHLAKYRADDVPQHLRSCIVCNYKVIVELDDGRLIASSVLDDFGLKEFDIEECVKNELSESRDEDWFYPVERPVCVEDLNIFIESSIEEGYKPLKSVLDVLKQVKRSGCLVTEGVKEILENVHLEKVTKWSE